MEHFWGWVRNKAARFTEKKYWIGIAFGLIFVCFMTWLVYDTLVGAVFASEDKQIIEANVRRLEEMENQMPPDINLAQKDDKKESQSLNEDVQGENVRNEQSQNTENQEDDSVLFVDETSEQQKIMTMENPDVSVFDQWFEDCALIGDSVSEGAKIYGFLNSSILFSKVGCSVAGAGELVESMVKMRPHKVFLALGINDIDNYGSKVEKFIDHYRNLISDIRSSLPDSDIYVSAILPMQQKAIDKEPKRKNVGLYNEKLEELCGEMDTVFLNPGFILEADASLFEPDGIHVSKNFYYKWLTYMADIAGISR